MTQIENEMECPNCHGKSVYYIYDSCRRVTQFFVSPYLNDLKVRHVFETRVMTREQDPPNKYSIEMKCPSCGEWTLDYTGIPLDWEARGGHGRLEPVYIPSECIVYDSKKEEGSP